MSEEDRKANEKAAELEEQIGKREITKEEIKIIKSAPKNKDKMYVDTYFNPV